MCRALAGLLLVLLLILKDPGSQGNVLMPILQIRMTWPTGGGGACPHSTKWQSLGWQTQGHQSHHKQPPKAGTWGHGVWAAPRDGQGSVGPTGLHFTGMWLVFKVHWAQRQPPEGKGLW